MGAYYKVDSRKLGFREYWNLAPGAKVLLPWILKALQVQIPLSRGLKYFDNIRDCEVNSGDVPPEVMARMDGLVRELEGIGFHSPRFFRYENPFDRIQIYFVTFLHESGQSTGRVLCSIAQKVSPPQYKVLFYILSGLTDGSFLMCSDQPAQMENPPEIKARRVIGGAPAVVFQAHQKELAALAPQMGIIPMNTQAELEEVSTRYEASAFDFNVRRGVYVPMSPAEVGECEGHVAVAEQAGPALQPHAAVLQEITQLQQKKAGWKNAILLLVITLLAFVGAGSQQWSWKTVLLLVPILFVHELGHYLAMKGFNYRNLRLFFIPFLGAAVTGKNYNVPGWQKSIVFLMGPVPGIFLGAILGSVAMIFHIPWLTNAAVMMLILNGFNLLPVLPLDGGWVLHSVLFCRSYRLDVAFKIFAILGLLALGFLGVSKIFMYVAIPLALGLPAAYRLAKITASLRESGIPPASTDDQNIPPDVALTIIERVKSAFPKAMTSRVVAEHVLTVYESLNARPPGWILTGAILTTHVVSVLMAVALAGVFLVGSRGGLPFGKGVKGAAPRYSLVCEPSNSWPPKPSADSWNAPQNTIVASCQTTAKAEEFFTRMTNEAPAGAQAIKMGSTVMLTLPETNATALKFWLEQARLETTDAFVENSNTAVSVRFTCVAPDLATAREIRESMDEYIAGGVALHLIPPWLGDDNRPSGTREQHARARKTYQKLLAANQTFWSSSEYGKLSQAMRQARKDGDSTELKRLQAEQKQASVEWERKEVDKLLKSNDPNIDPKLVALYATLLPVTEGAKSSKGLLELGQLMGQLPLVDGKPLAKDLRYSTGFGFVTAEGKKLTFFTSFRNLSAGLPAFTDWLCARNCSSMRYELASALTTEDDADP